PSHPAAVISRADRTRIVRIAIGDGRGADATPPGNIVRRIDESVAVVIACQKGWNIGRDLQKSGTGEQRACVLGAGTNCAPGSQWLRDAVDEERIDDVRAAAELQVECGACRQ